MSMINMINSVKNINFQWISGVGAAFFGSFAPIKDMLLAVFIFIAIDFVVGVLASYKRAIREHKEFAFQSKRVWDTIYKLSFSLIAVCLAFYMNDKIFYFVDLKLPNMVAGFICGTEFWSFLENAGDISQHPVFKGISKMTKKKINEVVENKEDTDCINGM